MASKKMIPFCILEILKKYTDERSCLLPSEIMQKVNIAYGEGTIKKPETVIENIQIINEFYHNIYEDDMIDCVKDENLRYSSNNRYYLLHRAFTFSEVIFLHNQILNSNALPNKEIADISQKLKSHLSDNQKKILRKNIITDGSAKTPNRNIYINLEIITESIMQKKNIEFIYNEYNIEKELVPRKRPYQYIVSPYAVICSYGSYFLVGYHIPQKGKRIYRIDKITNIKIYEDKSTKYVESEELDMKSYIKNSVYMHADEEKMDVLLKCSISILDSVIERFEDCRLREDKKDPNSFYATIPNTTKKGMKYWILQFTSDCEVIEPKELREEVQETLKQALSKY